MVDVTAPKDRVFMFSFELEIEEPLLVEIAVEADRKMSATVATCRLLTTVSTEDSTISKSYELMPDTSSEMPRLVALVDVVLFVPSDVVFSNVQIPPPGMGRTVTLDKPSYL